MERYVAVDNVCAWPNLNLLPNGKIVATIFNRPSHGQIEGEVECWESADGGCMWTRIGIPAPHEPGTCRMNVAAGLARNGDLVAIVSGWAGELLRKQILPSLVCRSTDGGRSWTRTESFPAPPNCAPIVPFGKIAHLPDGSLAVGCYSVSRYGAQIGGAWCMKSRDDGRTWGEPSLIAEDHGEATLFYAGEKRLLAALRTNHVGSSNLFVSEDCGASWRFQETVGGPKQHPADMVFFEPGRILLCFGIRYRGLFGIGASIGEEAGRKWYAPMLLVNMDDAGDGGYPSSVVLEDGTIVTAYYANRIAAHQRYHMGVVRWKMEELLQKNRPIVQFG